MPGRIISALSKCGKGNPVFVLDEIDKIGKDFKGIPQLPYLNCLIRNKIPDFTTIM